MGISHIFKELCGNYGLKKKTLRLNKLKNCVVAIDTAIYMWKYKLTSPLGIYAFIKLILEFKKKQIIPIFIIDGKKIELKRKLLEERREYKKLLSDNERVTSEDWSLAMWIFDFLAVPYYRVDYREAEGYCAYLNRVGIVDAVYTEDADVILYGCDVWIREMDFARGNFQYYDLREHRAHLGVTRMELAELLIPFGTDFNCPIYNISKDLYGLLKSHHTIYDPDLTIYDPDKKIENYQKIVNEFTSNDYDELTNIPNIRFIPVVKRYKLKKYVPEEILDKIFL